MDQQQSTVKGLYAKRTGDASMHRSSTSMPSSGGVSNDNHLNSNSATTTTTYRASGEARPCSEKEMKALMSMFCELMGLQMNTDRLNQLSSQYQSQQSGRHAKKQRVVASAPTTNNAKHKKLFQFPDNVPPPPGGWPDDLLWPVTTTAASTGTIGDKPENEDDDMLAGLPVLEDIPVPERKTVAATTRFQWYNNNNSMASDDEKEKQTQGHDKAEVVVTGVQGIAPYEWDAIERMAVEDALEHEERMRKHLTITSNGATATAAATTTTASKSHKSGSQQQPQQQASSTSSGASSTLQQQELERARHKQVMTWKNRVVAAFHRESQGQFVSPSKASSLPAVGGGSDDSLQELLDHSPVVQQQLHQKDDSTTHVNILQAFLPLILPKHHHHHHHRSSDNNNNNSSNSHDTPDPRGKDARDRLAAYMIAWHIPLLLIPSTNQQGMNAQNNGRSVLHTACWLGDSDLVTAMVHHWTAMNEQQQQQQDVPKEEQDNETKKDAAASTATTTTEPSAVLAPSNTKTAHKVPILDHPCHESGWAPLHYAAVSGSVVAVEVLLQHGCQVDVLTNNSLTWSRTTGKGVTARALVQAILQNQYETQIETHGMALQQVQKEFLKHEESAEHYKAMLRHIEERLGQVEKEGCTPKLYAQVQAEIEELERNLRRQQRLKQRQRRQEQEEANKKSQEEASTSAKRNRKKKKKQAKINESGKASASESLAYDAVSSSASTNKTNSDDTSNKQSSQQQREQEHQQRQQADDPLVTALLGMGFERKQIESGIQSCGGPTRATADDVVAWIFGQTEGGNNKNDRKQDPIPSAPIETTSTKATKGYSDVSAKKRETAVKRQEEERVALDLAKKREEQRRRNREWNKRTQQLQLASTNHVPTRAVDIHPFQQRVTTQRSGRGAAARPRGGGAPVTAAKPPARPRKVAESNSAGEAAIGTDEGDTWDMNEISTVGSLEHRTIEIIHNDDATISTLGSAQARSTPVASQAPVQPPAPPGFAVPSGHTQYRQINPWELEHDTSNAVHTEVFLPNAMDPNFGPPPGMHQSGLPPGQLHAPGLASNPLPTPQPPAQFSDPYAGSGAALPNGFPSGGSSLMGRTMPMANTTEPALHGLFPNSVLPGMAQDPFGGAGHGGIRHHPHVDSSLIDSISTARLGDTSLWGEDTSVVGSSRLMRNVIPTTESNNNADSDHHRRHGTNWGQHGDTVPRGPSIW